MKIVKCEVRDIRFPTSKQLDGSDAKNPDPDYSAAYVTLVTDGGGVNGHGLTFTIGRGNEIVVKAVESLSGRVIGWDMQDFAKSPGVFWSHLLGDSQLRWIGPDKGAIHMAAAAIVNAMWDLHAKLLDKPLWKVLCDMTPEQLVACVDFTYLADELTPQQALDMLSDNFSSRHLREVEILKNGFPAYTTSAGWLGYSESKVRLLSKQAVSDGFNAVKMKVGANLADDMARAQVIREEIGQDRLLMMDANQNWSVAEAIENMEQLARYSPYWIEEPTSPDDILGHLKISNALESIKVATGEHCHNAVMFKQLLSSGAIDVCQLDSCRLAGVNECIAVMLLAKKYDVPVCPHAGGVGLCEYVQHLSIFDYICVSASLEGRILEYVDHLHEHFVHPVVIREGAYVAPTAPGYSIDIKSDALQAHVYPAGAAWQY